MTRACPDCSYVYVFIDPSETCPRCRLIGKPESETTESEAGQGVLLSGTIVKLNGIPLTLLANTRAIGDIKTAKYLERVPQCKPESGETKTAECVCAETGFRNCPVHQNPPQAEQGGLTVGEITYEAFRRSFRILSMPEFKCIPKPEQQAWGNAALAATRAKDAELAKKDDVIREAVELLEWIGNSDAQLRPSQYIKIGVVKINLEAALQHAEKETK